VTRKRVWMVALTVCLGLLAPATALAQGAWVMAKGEARVGFGYQYMKAGNHLFSEPVLLEVELPSTSVDFGKSYSQNLSLEGEISITDRLALVASVVFVTSRYVEGGFDLWGDGSPNAESPIDDGNWHGSLQDGLIGAKYMALNDGKWALTPFVSYGYPTTDYATLGHSALGRGLNEFRMGLYWGRILSSSGKPFGYLEGGVAHAFMEKVGDVSLSRTTASLAFGYFLDSVTPVLFTEYSGMNGGLDWSRDLSLHDPDFEGTFFNHDRIADTDSWRVGLTVGVPVGLSWELHAAIATTLWGVNTHEAATFAVGGTWTFQAFGGTDWWYE